jgi:proteasome accessory factor C
MFRLDRMVHASMLHTPAAPPDDAARTDLSRGVFQPDPDDPLAVLVLERAARWVADYYPVEGQQDLADGRLRIELRYSSPQWLERLVLRLGGAATVTEPESLARQVRERAAAALALYSPAEQVSS